MTAVLTLVDGAEIRVPRLTQEQLDSLLSQVREVHCWMEMPVTEEEKLQDYVLSQHVIRVQVLPDPPVRPIPINVEERKRMAAQVYR